MKTPNPQFCLRTIGHVDSLMKIGSTLLTKPRECMRFNIARLS